MPVHGTRLKCEGCEAIHAAIAEVKTPRDLIAWSDRLREHLDSEEHRNG